MSSTIATVNQAKVDDRVVSALRDIKPMLTAFSYRPVNEGRIKDDQVFVPIATDPTARSKTAGTMVTRDGTVAGTQVTLDQFYGSAWDAKEGAMNRSLFENYWADKAAGAVHALGKQVVDAALATVTATNYSNVELTDKLTKAIADFGQGDLSTLRELAVKKIKNQRMSFGMNPAAAGAIFGQSTIALVFADADGENYFRTGRVPQLLGMNTWEYGAFPSNSENLEAAIFGQAAILVATAPVEALFDDGGNLVDRRIITDPESGISVLYSVTADGGGTIAGECAFLYGIAKGQDAVVRYVSA